MRGLRRYLALLTFEDALLPYFRDFFRIYYEFFMKVLDIKYVHQDNFIFR